jgi:hypothetical protein
MYVMLEKSFCRFFGSSPSHKFFHMSWRTHHDFYNRKKGEGKVIARTHVHPNQLNTSSIQVVKEKTGK